MTMDYYKDFKRERFHDEQLQRVVEILKTQNKIYLFEELIQVPIGSLGNYWYGCNKRDFDVLLEFGNCCILIETKVDSPEGSDKSGWQTSRVYNQYQAKWIEKPNIFIYLTYGLSEFYIKHRDNGTFSNGPHCTAHKHITCAQFQYFLSKAIVECHITDNVIVEWNKWLSFELTKRAQNTEFIQLTNAILSKYKKTLNLTDYPVNRLNLFLPEFTIPFYYDLCQEWNKLDDPTIGKACLYPVGRGYSATFDSILNFSELWWEKPILTCGDLLDANWLYFEFNEDYNLHLKSSVGVPNLNEIKDFILRQSIDLSAGFNAVVENYNQGAHVLFEWDLNILSNSTKENVTNIKNVIANALTILK